jgi:hypothetical protein
MKKLRLDFEQLAVESFDVTADAVRARGTVNGQLTAPASCLATDCNQNTCAATCMTCPDTCWNSCGETCYNSCYGTCEVTYQIPQPDVHSNHAPECHPEGASATKGSIAWAAKQAEFVAGRL